MKKLLLLIIIGLFASCKTHYTRAYRITTAERSYYSDYPTFGKDTVWGAELNRNRTVKLNFKIPYDSIISVDYNGKKYLWR